ncbi:MAG TPA: hydantoinase/oxoprolinase family protein [Gaiellaceae bacterium]|jgi:N-methylhydantoinase A
MSVFVVASDIGGTFTDTVLLDESGTVGRYKSPTVPLDPAAGVLATLELAAAQRGLPLESLLGQISLFAHGTTVATNAMIQDRRARVGLIQTRGFGDTISIMRGFKALGLDEEQTKNFRSLVKQPLVVPKQLIAEVTERVDYQGRVLMPLDEEDARAAIRRLRDAGAEVYAISLLWSFKNDSHECRIAELIEEEVPGALVTTSSALLPRLGEYRRTVTTAINASLRPTLRTAVESLQSKLASSGLKSEPLLMQSNGGLAPVSEIDREAASTVMSGPVGGVIACEFIGSLRGHRDMVTTDMGGTSFDVGLILDGRPLMANATTINRNDISLPSVAVRTVGAGSGSIAAVRNGYLTVGPQSAGAEPGPACYGRGGTQPTVADADLVLGYINPDNFLGGRLRLDVDLARKAIEEYVGRPLGMSVEEAAEGIKTIVDARMGDLIRQMTIEQGLNPKDFTMFAYGGAGPTHAFSYGDELGISEIVVPLTASVHSAFGIASSDLTAVEELSRPMQTPPGTTVYSDALSADAVNAVFDEISERASARLVAAGADRGSVKLARAIEMRFRFQIHVLTVPLDDGPLDAAGVDRAVGRFIETYEGRFGEGSAFKAAGIELTTFRVVARSATRRPQLRAPERNGAAAAPSTAREIFARGEWNTAAVLRGETLAPGDEVSGLAVIEMKDTTIVVGSGQHATVDEIGNVVIRLGEEVL